MSDRDALAKLLARQDLDYWRSNMDVPSGSRPELRTSIKDDYASQGLGVGLGRALSNVMNERDAHQTGMGVSRAMSQFPPVTPFMFAADVGSAVGSAAGRGDAGLAKEQAALGLLGALMMYGAGKAVTPASRDASIATVLQRQPGFSAAPNDMVGRELGSEVAQAARLMSAQQRMNMIPSRETLQWMKHTPSANTNRMGLVQ